MYILPEQIQIIYKFLSLIDLPSSQTKKIPLDYEYLIQPTIITDFIFALILESKWNFIMEAFSKSGTQLFKSTLLIKRSNKQNLY